MTLNDLHTGESGIITRIRGRGAFRRRIMEMGFIRGKPVTVIKSAPLKDPVEYRIMDSNVSLRRSEANQIEVVTDPDDLKTALSARPRFNGVSSREILVRSENMIDVALVGNPNCGKTTLFNRVSHSHGHVGNYPGVTVDKKQALFSHRGYTFRITDLPGTYSLSDYTGEERFVIEQILEKNPDVVINVVDANNLERSLYLTSQLIDMDITVVLALNMYDDLLEKKDIVDLRLLSRLLGIRIVPTISHRGRGIFRLLNHVIRVVEGKDPVTRHVHINYGEEIEISIQRIQEQIRKNPAITDHYSSRFIALRLLEGGKNCERILSDAENFFDIRQTARDEVYRLEDLLNEDAETLVADARYGFIAGALKETMKKSGRTPGLTRSQRIDRILTHKYLGIPIFLFFLWITFHATFSLGQYPMDWIEAGVDWLGFVVRNNLAEGMIRDMLVDGVIGGVGGVIVFLPNILILFFFISLMEDTGYMARTAFIMDRVMHLFGLHGKSFIPLVMGFGCNVPAIMATRTLENKNDRILTMLIIPFMSCSARLPVYVLVAGAIFPDRAGNIIFLLYMVGVLFSLLMSILFKKTLFRHREAPFVMELPVYRYPGMRVILRHMWRKGAQYLKKMGGVILLASIVIWALGYFPRNVEYSRDYDRLIGQAKENKAMISATGMEDTGVKNTPGTASEEQTEERIEMLQRAKQAERQEHSLIGRLGRSIEPAVRPLGFDWKMGVSLLTGFAAKEIVVSTMGVLYQVEEGLKSTTSLQTRIREQAFMSGPRKGQPVFTPISGFSFLIFVLLYLPCAAVITAIWRESGSWKWPLFVLFYTTVVAWVTSFAVYQVGTLLQMG